MNQSIPYPSEAFGYLLGVALYRETPFHLLLPHGRDPEIRFPMLPEEFVKRLRPLDDGTSFRRNRTPPRLPLSEVIPRLDGDCPKAHIYIKRDGRHSSLAELDDINDVQLVGVEDIPERLVVVGGIVCREIDEGLESACVMEQNPHPTPSAYVRQELGISANSQ